MMQRLLAEFEGAERCAEAIRKLKQRGAFEIEVYMPYPDKGIQQALSLKASPLPWYVLGAGLLGASLAYLILWYTNAVDFPINVGGHPDHAVPAFIPISFETLVLFAGCTAFVGALLLGGLPRLYHPVDEVEGFEGVSVDRFMLGVAGSREAMDEARTRAMLTESGALCVHEVGGGALEEAAE